MNTSKSLNEHEVYAHGKLVKIYVSPIKEILYRLRPKLEGESGKDRVAKVEAAEKAIVEAVEGLKRDVVAKFPTKVMITDEDSPMFGTEGYNPYIDRDEFEAAFDKAIKEWQ